MPTPSDARTELRALLRLGAPLAGANLAELGMVVTDMAIVGRLGAVELAAVGLTGGILVDAMAVAMGLLTVVGVLAAAAYGRGDAAAVNRITVEGLAIAGLLSVPVVALGLWLPELLAPTGQDPRVLALGETYLTALVWGIAPGMLYGVLADVATALHRPRVVLVASCAAVAVNAALTYGLVFGAAGLPALGVAGAGYATAVVNGLLLASLVAWCVGGGAPAGHLRPGRHARRPDADPAPGAATRDIVRLGLPVVGITLAESGLFSVLTVLMGTFGAAALAASRIVFAFVEVAGALGFALADAAAIRVALARGRGDRRAALRAGRLAVATGAGLMAALAAVAWLAPLHVVALFLGPVEQADAGTVALAGGLFAIGALYLVASGVQTIAEHALRGLEDTLVPMWQSIGGLWGVGLAGGAGLAFVLGLGPPGLWWGLVAGAAATAALLVARFERLLGA